MAKPTPCKQHINGQLLPIHWKSKIYGMAAAAALSEKLKLSVQSDSLEKLVNKFLNPPSFESFRWIAVANKSILEFS